MSLNDKHALFGKSAPKSGQAASKSAIESHAEEPAPVKPKVLATVGAGLQTTTMSAAAAEKKRAEARDWEERGQKNLKTSIFQWSPDYLAAAPCFENASNAYATLGDMKKAIDNLVLAADYNEKANCLTTAAFTYSKVAALCSSTNDFRQAALYYAQAADLYGLDGALDKMAEMLSKSAKEWITVDKAKARSTYLKACERMFPKTTSEDAIAKIHPKVIDIFRDTFLFLVKEKMVTEALDTAHRCIQIFTAFDSEVSLCKMLVSVTVLQLSAGHVVQADETFLQKHLSIPQYIRSKECALAEELLTAVKDRDVEKMDAAKRSPDLTYLEREIQNLAKSLSVIEGPNDWPVPVETTTTISHGSAHAVHIPALPTHVAEADEHGTEESLGDNEPAQDAADVNGEDEEEVDIC